MGLYGNLAEYVFNSVKPSIYYRKDDFIFFENSIHFIRPDGKENENISEGEIAVIAIKV